MSTNRLSGNTSVTTAAAAVVAVLVSTHTVEAAFDVVEKTIPQLEAAYSSGEATVHDVVTQYITRINTYDDNSVKGLNAVGQINPGVFVDAANVQALINSGATTAQYPLLGVPVLVKDSYDVRGMTTTNGVSVLNGVGTPGSTNLIAPNDAPSVAALKAAGAIILGKTNMSTMAYSFNGIDNAHGVVRNPYNANRTPGGSSSGSGAAAAANFAMLTMGGETGGSIRIPSAYNGVVGIKTSNGLVSPNGTWPLTPTRDVAGPIGKSVADVAYAMNALAVTTPNNIWNGTPFYPGSGPQPGAIGTGLGEGTDPTSKGLTAVTGTRPVDYTAFLSSTALQGKVIAIPSSVVRAGSSDTSKAYEATFNQLVYDNFQNQINVLKAQGATVKVVDVPAEVLYFNTIGKSSGATTTGFVDKSGNAIAYPTSTAGGTTPSNTWSSYAAAYYYEKQIESYGDSKIKNLRDFANALAAGSAAGAGSPFSTLGGAATNIANLATIWEAGNAKGFGDDNGDGLPDNPDAIKALQAFTTLRQDYINDWLTSEGIDAIVEPSMSNVAPLVAAGLRDPGVSGTDPYASGNGGHNGRFLGNILGMPGVSVPSGTVGDGTLWTGLQFLGRLDSEAFLLGLAYDYEQATTYRFAPDLGRYIPEPTSLTVIGLAGFVALRRRRTA